MQQAYTSTQYANQLNAETHQHRPGTRQCLAHSVRLGVKRQKIDSLNNTLSDLDIQYQSNLSGTAGPRLQQGHLRLHQATRSILKPHRNPSPRSAGSRCSSICEMNMSRRTLALLLLTGALAACSTQGFPRPANRQPRNQRKPANSTNSTPCKSHRATRSARKPALVQVPC